MKTQSQHGAGEALLAALATARATVATLEVAVQQAQTATTSDAPELLAIKATGISVRTQRAAIASGELPAVKVGREYQVRRSDLAAWIERRRVRPRVPVVREQTQVERVFARAERDGSIVSIRRARS